MCVAGKKKNIVINNSEWKQRADAHLEKDLALEEALKKDKHSYEYFPGLPEGVNIRRRVKSSRRSSDKNAD